MARYEVIPWKEFFKVEHNKIIVYRITPHRSVTNNSNRKMWRLLHKMYEIYDSVPSRLKREGYKFTLREKDNIWFDIVFKHKKIEFYASTSELFAKKFKEILENKLNVTVEEATLSDLKIPEQNTLVHELRYLRHDIFSQKTDATEQTTPISTVLSTIEELEDGDMARLSICNEVINRRKWSSLAEYAHEKIQKGITPKRARITVDGVLGVFKSGIGALVNEVNDVLQDTLKAIENVFFKKDERQEQKEKLIKNTSLIQEIENGRISVRTYEKQFQPVWKSHIRVAAHSENHLRREMIANTLSTSLSEIGEDNELKGIRIRIGSRKLERIINELNTLRLSLITENDGDVNIVSCDEMGKMVQYPTRQVQDKYCDELEINKTIETEVSKVMFEGGLKLGDYTHKSETREVFQPTNDYDELCLPRIVIGGMGQGKTKGYGANFLVQAVKNNFGAIAIDPAKGEIGDEVERVLDKDNIIRINLANTPISLDWREVKHSTRAKNRLANTIISFFNNSTDETGAQTNRFLRALVMGMKTDKLSEILKIMEDKEYRKEILEIMAEGIHKTTLSDLDEMSDGKRMQVLAPIYNRLDIVLGDEYLNECMNAENGLDLVELMSQRKAIIIDVPKKDLGPEGVELIISLLTTKINLAMTMRAEHKQFPFFVLFDEPHQFIKSSRIWKSAAVESRKWRVGYIWMFHSWEQIPRDLAEIIKAAMPHYHLYPSSKKTFQDLKEEIAPISVEDALTLKRYHAINVLRVNGEATNPFVAHMTPPPSEQRVS